MPASSTLFDVVAGNGNLESQEQFTEAGEVARGGDFDEQLDNFLFELESQREIELPKFNLFHTVNTNEGVISSKIEVSAVTVIEGADIAVIEPLLAAQLEPLSAEYPENMPASIISSEESKSFAISDFPQMAPNAATEINSAIENTLAKIEKPIPIASESPLHKFRKNIESPNSYNLADSLEQQEESPLATTLAQPQGSGKSLPQDGKFLPGSLPFYSQLADETSIQSNSSDLTNSAAASKLLQLNTTDTQTTRQLIMPSPSQTEALQPSLDTKPSTGVEKLPGIFTDTATSADSNRHFSINSTAGSAQWNTQLSHRIRWMSSANISTAELKLHPAELGTIEIKITTEDDQTKISFVASSTLAKDAIESSLPKLRDMLNGGGLQLSQSDVSHRNSKEGDHSGASSSSDGDEKQLDTLADENSFTIQSHGSSRIDHYV
jgi:flagellar hook-length control protein FliK